MLLVDYITAGNSLIPSSYLSPLDITPADLDNYCKVKFKSWVIREDIIPEDTSASLVETLVQSNTLPVFIANKWKYDTLYTGLTTPISVALESTRHIENSGKDVDTSDSTETFIGKDTHSGTDSKINTGTDTLAKTGTDELKTDNTNTSTKSGTDTDTLSGSDTSTDTLTHGLSVKHNFNTTQTNTPGTVNETHNVYAYDSAAATPERSDSRTETAGNIKNTGDNTDTNSGEDKDVAKTEYGKIDTIEYDTTVEDVLDGKNTTTYNTTDTKTVNMTENVQYGQLIDHDNTTTVEDSHTLAHGHIIDEKSSTNYDPEYVAKIRQLALFSLLDVIAKDIIPVITEGVEFYCLG